MWYMVVEDGNLTYSEADPREPEELIPLVLGADRFDMVPLPDDVGSSLIAYADAEADKWGRIPNVFVEGHVMPIRGPIVILGREGEGHRWLTDEELSRLEVSKERRAGLGILRRNRKVEPAD